MGAYAEVIEIIESSGLPPTLTHVYNVRREGELPPLMMAAFDVCNKLNKLASAGRARIGVEPCYDTYLGEAHAAVAQRAAQRVTQQRAAVLVAAAAAAAVADADCHPNIQCAREHAGGGGMLELYGVVRGACSHGFPLRCRRRQQGQQGQQVSAAQAQGARQEGDPNPCCMRAPPVALIAAMDARMQEDCVRMFAGLPQY